MAFSSEKLGQHLSKPIGLFLALCCTWVFDTIPAQNLILNPGFEEPAANPMFVATGVNESPHWSRLDGTTDFFHASYPPSFAVPDNFRGTQTPANGMGYAGIIASMSMEFLVMELEEPLIRDQIYDLSFKVSLSELSQYGIDGLGITLRSEPPLKSDLRDYQYTIRNRKGRAIIDTSGWQNIAGQFRADGGERFLLIGSLPEMDIVTSSGLAGTIPWAYYFIDDVYLAPCPKPVITRFELDTTVCDDSWVTLRGLQDANNHRWVDGGTSDQRIVRESGVFVLDNHYECRVVQQIYQVESSDCGCTLSLPTLFNEGISFPMVISPLVRRYDLIMVNGSGELIFSLYNQDGKIDAGLLPKASAAYLWKARLTCLNALDQPYTSHISGRLIIQN